MGGAIKKIILTTATLLVVSNLFTRFYESRLFLWEIKHKWGQQELQAHEFKTEADKIKSTMAYSAVKTQYGKGRKKEKIVEQLGPADVGHETSARWHKKAIGYSLEDWQDNPWHLVFYYNKQGLITRAVVERQLADDTVWGVVGNALIAPALMLYFIVRRVLATRW